MRKTLQILLLFAFTWLLLACGVETGTPISASSIAEATPGSTATPIPTASPTPTITPTPVVFLEYFTNGNYLTAITLDLMGNVWAAGGGGVIRWDMATGAYQKFSMAEGLPGNRAADIATGQDGAIWVHWSYDRGVSRYLNGQWAHFNSVEDQPGKLTGTLYIDAAGRVWVFTEDGIAGYQENHWEWIDPGFDSGEAEVLSHAEGIDGSLWITTADGVARLDGNSWTTWEDIDVLPLRLIWSSPNLFITSDGTVWVDTLGGVAAFRDEEWIHYDRTSLSDITHMILDQEGVTWFATYLREEDYLPAGRRYGQGGIYHFDGENWGHDTVRWDELPSDVIYDFVMTPDGELWATTSNGMVHWLGSFWEPTLGLPEEQVRDLFVSQDGSLWLITQWEGLYKVSGIQYIGGSPVGIVERLCVGGSRLFGLTFTAEDLANECPNERSFNDVVAGPDGEPYFASAGYGVVIPVEGGGYVLKTESEVPTNNIVHFVIDQHGDFWLAHGGIPGLFYFHESDWISLADQEMAFSVRIRTIEEAPDGRIWVGTSYGVSVWDDQMWAHWLPKDNNDRYTQMDVNMIAFHGEDVWISTSKGIFRIPRGELSSNHHEQLPPIESWTEDKVQQMAVLSESEVWVGSNSEGLAYYDGIQWATFTEAGCFNLETSNLKVMTADHDEALWVGTTAGGACRYDGQTWEIFDQVLPGNWVTDIEVSPTNEVWIGTTEGLALYDGQNVETMNHILPADYVIDILITDADEVWIAAVNGVALYDGQNWLEYDWSNILPGDILSMDAVPSGSLWVGTSAGLLRIELR